MKNSLRLAIAVTLWAALPAQAQKQLDLSTMTCKRFFEYDKDNLAIMLMWLDGYYSEDDAPPIVDFDKMKENATKLGGYCAKNPEVGLITAAEETIAE